jgi:hypothetical protein
MTRKETALASLDIVGEGLAQEDGLAERLMRQRSSKPEGTTRPYNGRPAIADAPTCQRKTLTLCKARPKRVAPRQGPPSSRYPR